jgi:phosphoribosylaminoimidazole-succinocarboxamide synthase
MEHTKILDKVPGKTIYAGKKSSEVYHYFTDTYLCPITGNILEIPSKGYINNYISSFLFSKLHCLELPSHFIRVINARQSLMYASHSLPFEITVKCMADKIWAETFDSTEGKFFSIPLIEHSTIKAKRTINESYILALEWLSCDDLDALHAFVIKATYLLQGLCIASQLILASITFSFGQHPQGEFFLTGALSPETMCLFDLQNKQYLGQSYISGTSLPPLEHYKIMAQRLNISMKEKNIATVLPFPGN